MRDPNRIPKYMDELAALWAKYPDLRFSQLIVNFLSCQGSDMYYVEDEEFFKQLKDFYGEGEYVRNE